MITDRFNRILIGVAALLLALAVGACAIQLRSGADQTVDPASAIQETDPLAAKLAQCRTVNYEQKDAWLECRKVWAEKRRQFLGQREGGARPAIDGTPANSPIPPSPKDQSRLPSGYSSVPTLGGNER
ncbi:putative entry exclusion protein TrbK-alt [Bradyrhizobium sp. CCGUVB23]|uniref:putative entry exclusion protein TrbK-alt n=1 Tax=Bradyrhizobium sp. CCGUVB23 TaxID=2949630 RepID=UPI0020B3CC97|nr:putative entry exclusion protein TrbK-alt [Bradyrhizobium sp. CCGUVB23]MCP3459676.1 putative entry exclusion protein TrbK-alt [Bradyrhizobium sp. CCGUVB23]